MSQSVQQVAEQELNAAYEKLVDLTIRFQSNQILFGGYFGVSNSGQEGQEQEQQAA